MDDTGTDQDQKAADDEPTDDARTPDIDRLDELGDRIQSVRSEAEDVVDGVADTDDDKGDSASGDTESTGDDDQTIAPPG